MDPKVKKEMKIVKRILASVLTILFLLSGCAAPAKEGIEVRSAWARPASQGDNGAVYFVIRSSEPDEITGVSSAVAEAAEMHESMMNGDVMEMNHLESVPLGAGEEVKFEPGGLHIMLVNLKEDLKTGDDIEISLHFKNYQDILLHVPVQDTPAMEAEGELIQYEDVSEVLEKSTRAGAPHQILGQPSLNGRGFSYGWMRNG
jgi:copper(I)-binding protein